MSASKLRVGLRALAATNTGEHMGLIKFVGQTHFTNGELVGLQLDDFLGNHDGTYKDRQYFKCPAGTGIFVRPEAILMTAEPEVVESVPAASVSNGAPPAYPEYGREDAPPPEIADAPPGYGDLPPYAEHLSEAQDNFLDQHVGDAAHVLCPSCSRVLEVPCGAVYFQCPYCDTICEAPKVKPNESQRTQAPQQPSNNNHNDNVVDDIGFWPHAPAPQMGRDQHNHDEGPGLHRMADYDAQPRADFYHREPKVHICGRSPNEAKYRQQRLGDTHHCVGCDGQACCCCNLARSKSPCICDTCCCRCANSHDDPEEDGSSCCRTCQNSSKCRAGAYGAMFLLCGLYCLLPTTKACGDFCRDPCGDNSCCDECFGHCVDFCGQSQSRSHNNGEGDCNCQCGGCEGRGRGDGGGGDCCGGDDGCCECDGCCSDGCCGCGDGCGNCDCNCDCGGGCDC